jgi:hypothetical protein
MTSMKLLFCKAPAMIVSKSLLALVYLLLTNQPALAQTENSQRKAAQAFVLEANSALSNAPSADVAIVNQTTEFYGSTTEESRRAYILSILEARGTLEQKSEDSLMYWSTSTRQNGYSSARFELSSLPDDGFLQVTFNANGVAYEVRMCSQELNALFLTSHNQESGQVRSADIRQIPSDIKPIMAEYSAALRKQFKAFHSLIQASKPDDFDLQENTLSVTWEAPLTNNGYVDNPQYFGVPPHFLLIGGTVEMRLTRLVNDKAGSSPVVYCLESTLRDFFGNLVQTEVYSGIGGTLPFASKTVLDYLPGERTVSSQSIFRVDVLTAPSYSPEDLFRDMEGASTRDARMSSYSAVYPFTGELLTLQELATKRTKRN